MYERAEDSFEDFESDVEQVEAQEESEVEWGRELSEAIESLGNDFEITELVNPNVEASAARLREIEEEKASLLQAVQGVLEAIEVDSQELQEEREICQTIAGMGGEVSAALEVLQGRQDKLEEHRAKLTELAKRLGGAVSEVSDVSNSGSSSGGPQYSRPFVKERRFR